MKDLPLTIMAPSPSTFTISAFFTMRLSVAIIVSVQPFQYYRQSKSSWSIIEARWRPLTIIMAFIFTKS